MLIFDYVWNKVNIARKKAVVGEHLRINGRIHMHGAKGNIHIGDYCIITSHEDKNPTAGGHSTHLVAGPKGRLTIGNNVGISYAYIVAYDSVTIEDNVLIGADVKIWDTDFHALGYCERMNDFPATTKPIHIKEGAFIGACSIVLKGVTIGEHSVIGAGSVVTHNVPDGEIWAGNPAKKVGNV